MLDFNTLTTFSTREKIYKTFPMGRGFLRVFQSSTLLQSQCARATSVANYTNLRKD